MDCICALCLGFSDDTVSIFYLVTHYLASNNTMSWVINCYIDLILLTRLNIPLYSQISLHM